MNERIKELAEQAGMVMYPTGLGISENTLWGDKNISKFAELIVRECARVARATPSPNFHEHLKQQLGHTWDMASVEAGKQIVKHFGVKE